MIPTLSEDAEHTDMEQVYCEFQAFVSICRDFNVNKRLF